MLALLRFGQRFIIGCDFAFICDAEGEKVTTRSIEVVGKREIG